MFVKLYEKFSNFPKFFFPELKKIFEKIVFG